MFVETVDLYAHFGVKKPENSLGVLTCYVLGKPCVREERTRPAMLVLPGGGYVHKSNREKEIVAIEYVNKGFNAYTLEYTTVTSRYPTQLIEGAMAMAYIREMAEEHNTNTQKVSAIGFSAGGHLCAMLATLFKEKVVTDILGNRIIRPDCVVLCYPVISSGEYAHKGSFEQLCGEGNKELYEYLSLENRVTENSSPAFIWSTSEDGAVPCENSLLLALAYRKAGIPIELHIFEKGNHGLSVCSSEVGSHFPYPEKWFELSISYLRQRGFKIEDI